MSGKFEDTLREIVEDAVERAFARRQTAAPTPPQPKTPAQSAYLTTKSAAAMLGLSPSTLEAWRAKGKEPKATKLGNAVRYERAALEKWLAANTKGSAK
jgi:excisionase family DNA binding protein